MNKHFLQSEDWEKFQRDLGEETVRLGGEKFEAMAIVKKTRLGAYLYLPYGPALSEEAPLTGLDEAIGALRRLGREKRAMFIRVEPSMCLSYEKMRQRGFVKTRDLSPKETLVYSLAPTEEEILRDLAKKTKRGQRYYREIAERGLEIEVSKKPEEVKILTKLQGELASKKKIGVFNEEYFKRQLAEEFASLYIVRYTNAETGEKRKPVAAVMVFDWGKTRYYMQATNDKAYNRLSAPTVAVVWAILDAKEKGLEEFDFWGIAPEGAPASHPWAGFTAFKKTFGGEERKYTGTWDLVLDAPRYRLYKGLRAVNRAARKLWR